MRCLITNTEQVQPHDSNDTIIVLYGRNPAEPEERYRINAVGYRPYFYAPKAEYESSDTFILEQECVEEVAETDFDAFGEADEELVRVYTPRPQHVREAKELFSDHYNADVPFTNRFRIDTGIRDVVEAPDPEDGSTTIDCHWRELEPVVPE